MKLSRTELNVLQQAAIGNRRIPDIASALDKDASQIYLILRNLDRKGFATLENGVVVPSNNTPVNLLLQELSSMPNIADTLSGCGIRLFTAILEPKSVCQIMTATGIKRSTVFLKLKEAGAISLVKATDGKYSLNYKIWPRIIDFLTELKKYDETTDIRVPPGAIIYRKNEDEIVFSTKAECDATLTGFSAYERFGIRLLTKDNTYYLPRKTLTMKEVFMHSLYRAESEGDARDYIFIALFYLKHKNDLVRIRHPIVDNIKRILNGENIKYYPAMAEIRERAEVYDIKV
jgi:hypothetical protein